MIGERCNKKVRRFGKDIIVKEITSDKTTVQFHFIDDERYVPLYEKLEPIFENFLSSSVTGALKCTISFLKESYISFLFAVTSENKHTVFPLNFNIKTHRFERDKEILKSVGITRRDIRKSVLKSGEKMKLLPHSVMRIDNGVALYFIKKGKDGEICSVKIRQDALKK